MDSEFANFFAEQEASLGSALDENQHRLDNGPIDSWNAPDGEETDVLNQILGGSAPDYSAHLDAEASEEQMDGDALDPQVQDGDAGETGGASGGYSPSAVPYEQQYRGYSPSGPTQPTQGYSPSNVVLALRGDSEADADGSEMQESRNGTPHQLQKQLIQAGSGAKTDSPATAINLLQEHTEPPTTQKAYLPTASGLPGFSVDSLGTTPYPEQSAPALGHVPVLNPNATPKTPFEAAQTQAREHKHDHGAWKDYLTLAENTGDLETIKDVYEEALGAFPNTVRPLLP